MQTSNRELSLSQTSLGGGGGGRGPSVHAPDDVDSSRISLYDSIAGVRVPGIEYETTVFRTRTELSDIQIATLLDVHNMTARRSASLCQVSVFPVSIIFCAPLSRVQALSLLLSVSLACAHSLSPSLTPNTPPCTVLIRSTRCNHGANQAPLRLTSFREYATHFVNGSETQRGIGRWRLLRGAPDCTDV